MLDLFDVHTHTIASGHAFSTMREIIDSAKAKGLKLVGIADHALLSALSSFWVLS